MNARGIPDTARVLPISPTTVLKELKKLAHVLPGPCLPQPPPDSAGARLAAGGSGRWKRPFDFPILPLRFVGALTVRARP
jgi:hypothetical protein